MYSRASWRILVAPIILMLLMMLACYVVSTYVVVVSGNSMEPTYKSGTLLWVRQVKSLDDLGEDYPVCHVELSSGEHVLKRLIGRPGDTVVLKDGDTYVNGELILQRITNSWDNMSYELGDNEYLFLGDNRAESIDARAWAEEFVSFERIKSVVVNSGLS